MANHKQAIKRARQDAKRRLRNRHIVSTVRTYIKRVRAAIDARDAETAQSVLGVATRALNMAKSKGTIHRNQVARKISRLTKAVNALTAG